MKNKYIVIERERHRFVHSEENNTIQIFGP